MTSIATVKPKLDSTTIAAGQLVQLSFAVTNTSGRSLMMGAKMLADPPAEEGWCRLTGNSERQFGEDDFDQFDIEVKVPADARPGTYKFRLLVFETVEPGENYTESGTVSIQVPEADAPPKAKPDKGGFPLWIAIVAGVLVLLIGGGILAYVLLSGKDSQVPEVTGLKLDDAIVKLEEAGFEMPETGGVIEEWTGEAEAGIVIKQQPDAGSEKTDDTQVTLTIEELTVSVPPVIGMKVPAATTLLNEARLSLSSNISYERSDQFPGGAIIAQVPDANERAIPGQEVVVTVAQQLTRVPDLNRKSYNEARIALETLGLSVGKVSHEKTGGAPDTVVRQQPGANAEADAASKVDLWLVEKKLAVPSVKGKDIGQAKAIMEKAGFKAVLFPMALPPKSQQTRRFNKPMVEHGGKASGLRLDWCLTWGQKCGRPAADHFCQKKGYRGAVQLGQDKDIGHTKLLKTGQVCKQPMCDGFTFIICQKETSQPVNKVQDQRPSANTKVYTGTEVTLVYYKAPTARIGKPFLIQPQMMKKFQAGKLQLRNIEGDLRSVAPQTE